MDYELIFYVCGGVLAASAVVFTFLGLRLEKFPGKAGSVVALYFIALAVVASTFAVLHSQHEEEHREHEAGLPQATEEAEAEESE
jgi:mannose/fructose/N-acetylgalactosamine-specific phosphotransferase system component IIC